jgi:hypothetical protein
VIGALAPREALADNFGIFIDENRHVRELPTLLVS